LYGRKLVGERERIKGHGKPGIPEALQGKYRNTHGVNGLKIINYDNSVLAISSLGFFTPNKQILKRDNPTSS
jgi:hypothetical protein